LQCGNNCRVVLQVSRGTCGAFSVDTKDTGGGWYLANDIDTAINYANDKCAASAGFRP
jgi:hypothetical protein